MGQSSRSRAIEAGATIRARARGWVLRGRKALKTRLRGPTGERGPKARAGLRLGDHQARTSKAKPRLFLALALPLTTILQRWPVEVERERAKDQS